MVEYGVIFSNYLKAIILICVSHGDPYMCYDDLGLEYNRIVPPEVSKTWGLAYNLQPKEGLLMVYDYVMAFPDTTGENIIIHEVTHVADYATSRFLVDDSFIRFDGLSYLELRAYFAEDLYIQTKSILPYLGCTIHEFVAVKGQYAFMFPNGTPAIYMPDSTFINNQMKFNIDDSIFIKKEE